MGNTESSRDRITTITALILMALGLLLISFSIVISYFNKNYASVGFAGSFLSGSIILGGFNLWQNKWNISTTGEVTWCIVVSIVGLILYIIDVILNGVAQLLIPFPLVFSCTIIVSTIHWRTGPHPQEPEPPDVERNRSISERYYSADD
ncbi:MAG: hypothetical protein ACFFF4_14220 [Candidatus Thorarchaeota archaeon]